MVKFNYDNIGTEKITLEFLCSKCHSTIETGMLDIPEWNLNCNIVTRVKHHCRCACCKEYNIELFNGIYDSYGIIQELEEGEINITVHEMPDIKHDSNTIVVDTIEAYQRIKSIVSETEMMKSENRDYIYCLLFSNLISILDSFIKIYTEPLVLNDQIISERFCKAFHIKKINREKIEKIYKRKSFQSINNQEILFKEVFNVDIEFVPEISDFNKIRNLLIHRNAINQSGYINKISKTELLRAIDIFQKHTRNIHIKLKDYTMKKCILGYHELNK
ncbi:MAG: hypothetical protein IJ145_04555 [Prevotella sp.]|nr:hypothetical protein [Prevotella sp.]